MFSIHCSDLPECSSLSNLALALGNHSHIIDNYIIDNGTLIALTFCESTDYDPYIIVTISIDIFEQMYHDI